MTTWPYLLLLIPVVPLAWEDFRTRRVAIIWLAVLLIATTWVGLLTAGMQILLIDTVINNCLIISIGAAVAGYLYLRGYHLRRVFGAGDLAMLFALTPLFAPAAYLKFLLAACGAALLWWCITRPSTIPFAGVMSLVLAGYSLCKSVGLWS